MADVQALGGLTDAINSVYKTLADDPSKLVALTSSDANPAEVVTSLLGSDSTLDATQVAEVAKSVVSNNAVQLFQKGEGLFDASQLMSLVGNIGDKSVTRATGVAALLDGKFDINDIMTIANLLMGKGLSSSSSSSLFGTLASTLLGGSSSSNAAAGILGSMLGLNTQTTTSPAGGFLSNLFGKKTETTTVTTSNGTDVTSLLTSMLAGGTSSQATQTASSAATSLVQNLLGSNATTTNSNGTVNLDTVLSLASLLGGK